MFRAEGAPQNLRREIAGETLVVRAGRQTTRGDVRLAGVQGQQLSEAQGNVAKEISRRGMAVEEEWSGGVLERWKNGIAAHHFNTPFLHYSVRSSVPHVSQHKRF